MRLYIYLCQRLRRWRNLDALGEAQTSALQAQAAALEALGCAQASREQLAVCRALLAVTMRERDTAQAAMQRIAGDLARLKAKQRRELRESRLWVTRCRAVNVSEN